MKRGRKRTTTAATASTKTKKRSNDSVSSKSRDTVGVKFSDVLDDDSTSVQHVMGSTIKEFSCDDTERTAERKKGMFESRFSDILMATNALQPEGVPASCAVAVKNVVATADVQCAVDLRKFWSETSNVATLKNSVLYIATRMPSARLALFESGKIMCSGTRSIEDSKFAIKKVIMMLRRAGFSAKFSKFEVITTVSHLDTKYVIDIQSFYETYTENCTVNIILPL